MRIFWITAFGALGVFLLLFGALNLGLTQTVNIRPFSWETYWRETRFLWFLATLCIPSGFGLWRLSVQEFRVERRRCNKFS